MERYHMIKSVLGGSDVYNEKGERVGYSLPSVLGGGEDFYDMDGKPLGLSFDDEYGGYYIGNNGSYGPMDREFLMGQNIYMHGDMEDKQEPEPWESPLSGFDAPEPDDLGTGMDFSDHGFDMGEN